MSYEVGRHTYGAPLKIMSWSRSKEVIKVGKFCSFATNIQILTGGEHPTSSVSTYPFHRLGWGTDAMFSKGVPSIGNDVWICSDVKILSGVTIGDGAVIGASSVVTKDVPPYAVVCGNPAVVKKLRFTPEQIADLLKYPWWDLPDSVLQKEVVPLMKSVDATIAKLKEIYKAS